MRSVRVTLMHTLDLTQYRQQVVASAREFEKLSPNTVKGYGALSTAGQNTTHHGPTEASIAATKVSTPAKRSLRWMRWRAPLRPVSPSGSPGTAFPANSREFGRRMLEPGLLTLKPFQKARETSHDHPVLSVGLLGSGERVHLD